MKGFKGFMFLLLLAQGWAGCDGSASPQPTPPPQPGPPGPAAAPSIAAISPALGSTGGGTIVNISGTGFQQGATVTLDGAPRTATVQNSATIQFTTPAHSSGPVDVVVTNPNGQLHQLAGGYTFAPPQSFDFNGSWVGYALAHPETTGRSAPQHSDMDMQFTIQNNVVTRFTCGSPATVTFSSPPSISNGEFTAVDAAGAVIAGRIVSHAGAVGTIDTDLCPATRWAATRQ